MAPTRKILISLFILLNLLAMVRVHMPLNTAFLGIVYKPIDTYLSYFSIYQDWMMFAPNPNRLNVNVFAEIEFEDGFIEKYEFPDSSKMNLADKYTYGEKFRKIISEGIRKDENSFMWKDVAKFALRKNREKNFNRIPVKVHLVRAWDEMPDVNVEFRPRNQKYELKNTFRFFTYEVL